MFSQTLFYGFDNACRYHGIISVFSISNPEPLPAQSILLRFKQQYLHDDLAVPLVHDLANRFQKPFLLESTKRPHKSCG